MQHQLGDVLPQYCDEGVAVGEPTAAPLGLGLWWMMDQHDAEPAGMLAEESREARKLRRAEPAGGAERCRRHRRRHADEGEWATHPHEWKLRRRVGHNVAAHVFGPVQLWMAPLRPHIGVVVAGHDSDVLRGAEPREERARGRKLSREREIDEVAGDRNLVDRLRL